MFQKAFSFAGTLLLAGVAVLMMPGPSQAQHGGGHGGGGHGGGGHFGGGGAHFSGGGGHFSGAHHEGFRGGMFRGGAREGRSHYGYGRYRPYYGGYGYYPYYDGGYYPYNYDTSSPTYDSGYSGSYGTVPSDAPLPADEYQAFNPSSTATAEPDTSAHLTVKTPADARIWFEGAPTTSTGPVREFNSPPLAAGSRYSYEVRARWNENGHDVTQTQQVQVTAGAHVSVSFPVPPKTAGQASAVKKAT